MNFVVLTMIVTVSFGFSFAFYKASNYRPITDEEIVEIDDAIG